MDSAHKSLLLLGRYALLRPLGDDGVAAIFLARAEGAEGFRKPVLLRLIHPHVVRSTGGRVTLVREAKITSQLVHPNIVQTIDFGEEDEGYIEVTEYVHGYELATLAGFRARHNEPWSFEHAAHLILELLRAVAYAHHQCDRSGQALGVIHGFISPHNIIVSNTGQVKIGGFGVAETRREVTLQSLNKLVKGKLAYQSPEQIGGGSVDQRADLFALSVIFFELLAGIRLFHSDISEAETVKNVLQAAVPPIESVRPDLPPGLGQVLRRGLARDPADRFGTAQDFTRQVSQLLPPRAGGQLNETFEQTVSDITGNQIFLEFAPPLFDLDQALAGPPLNVADDPAEGKATDQSPGQRSDKKLVARRGARQSRNRRRALAVVSLLFALVITVAGIALALKTNQTDPPPANMPVAVIFEKSGNVSGRTRPDADRPGQAAATHPRGDSREPAKGPLGQAGRPDASQAPPPPEEEQSPRPRPAPRPESVSGKTISRLLLRRQAQLRRCLQQHRGDTAGLPSVHVRLAIDGQGRAGQVAVLPAAVGETPLGRCFSGVVRGVRFPAHGGPPLTYSVPLYITMH